MLVRRLRPSHGGSCIFHGIGFGSYPRGQLPSNFGVLKQSCKELVQMHASSLKPRDFGIKNAAG